MAYVIDKGGPIAPNKFVIRQNGLLVRNDLGKPILFDSFKEAEAAKSELENERQH